MLLIRNLKLGNKYKILKTDRNKDEKKPTIAKLNKIFLILGDEGESL